MNLFIFEIKNSTKYTLLWSFMLSLVAWGFLGMYPSFSGDIESTKAVLEKLPESVRLALNVDLNLFFSLAGFYSYVFNFLMLAGSIMSLNLSLKLFSQESSQKTADFLLTKPISRKNIFIAKLCAGIFQLLIFNLIFSLITLIAVNSIDKNNGGLNTFVLINLSLFIVQLIFFALGSFLGTILSKVKNPISIAMPTVFAFFIISALDSAIKSIKLSELTPFSFFNRNYILLNNNYETKYLIISFVVIFLFFFFALNAFARKEIKN